MKSKCKNTLFSITEFFEESQIFAAVQQGLLMMIPLIVVGSFALMIKSLPIDGYQNILAHLWNGRVRDFLDYVYAGSFQFFSVALAVMISINYAILEQKKRSEYAGTTDIAVVAILTLMALGGYLGIQYKDLTQDIFGTMHTFSAMFISLGTCKLYYHMKRSRFLHFCRVERDADGAYVKAVEAIVPACVIVLSFGVVHLFLRSAFHVKNLHEGLEQVASRFMGNFDTGFVVGLVIIFLTHALWFFGIHGSNVFDSVIQQNYAAIVSTEVYSKTFQDVFVIMGGVGATISLVICILLFSRKRGMKSVAKLAFPAGLMNINELVTFGLPVIFNPIFIIPFLLVPVLNHIIAYSAIALGIVPHVQQTVEWTTPVLFSGYLATGSIRGSILQMVCLIIGIFVYLPFLRLYEEHSTNQTAKNVELLVQELKVQEQMNDISCLTKRDDALGSVARMLAYDLQVAIKKKELFLVYQPQVSREEKCIGAEALLRWMHPDYGFIYPPLIIELAKEKGLLHELESFIFDTAAQAIAKIEKQELGEFKISINITNESLLWDQLEQCIDHCCEQYEIKREHMWIEITEQDAWSSSQDCLSKIEHLKNKGHKFLIDDFGMGHTSLLYLQSSCFSVVKLDGALTRNVLENERDCKIISSVVYLGESLHFYTIAEYVETREQRDRLVQLGVDAFQGYLYSKPIALDELIVWMEHIQA